MRISRGWISVMVTMDAARGVGVTYLTSKKFDKPNLIIKCVNFINIAKFTHLRLTKKRYKYV